MYYLLLPIINIPGPLSQNYPENVVWIHLSMPSVILQFRSNCRYIKCTQFWFAHFLANQPSPLRKLWRNAFKLLFIRVGVNERPQQLQVQRNLVWIQGQNSRVVIYSRPAQMQLGQDLQIASCILLYKNLVLYSKRWFDHGHSKTRKTMITFFCPFLPNSKTVWKVWNSTNIATCNTF